MVVYTIDFRDGRRVTDEFNNLDEAKAAAASGMFYTGLPVWIMNQEGETVTAAEWITGDPMSLTQPDYEFVKIVEWENGIGYYRTWSDELESIN